MSDISTEPWCQQCQITGHHMSVFIQQRGYLWIPTFQEAPLSAVCLLNTADVVGWETHQMPGIWWVWVSHPTIWGKVPGNVQDAVSLAVRIKRIAGRHLNFWSHYPTSWLYHRTFWLSHQTLCARLSRNLMVYMQHHRCGCYFQLAF